MHLPSWRSLAALGGVALLLALAMHPATAAVMVAAAVVLLPVALFGLVRVPHSLGNQSRPPRLAMPVRVRAQLFQRPPPLSLQ
ncbi:MAG TPA: hypothetical protein VHU89_14770 [Acidobacteriaceae bacterium]|nr:hypothetical protein [Acidobacteriaceae bacterium]